MKPQTRRAVACLAWSAVVLLAAVSASQAQRNDLGACRQGLLAMIVMIDAEEQDKSHYQSTAKSMVESCGPPATAKTTAATPPVAFDREMCGKLALSMLDTIEGGKLESPQFAQARDEFAGKCLGG
jgi:hypothetical protein